jgi:acetoin utilization deacetylase AcuC-like enzyme
MKVIFHKRFHGVYASEPAAAQGRMEAVTKCLGNRFDMIEAVAANPEDIEAVHSATHIECIHRIGLYGISALAAGGAVQAAEIGMSEPAFALIRPPGHHASRSDAWGFCYFNNMAVALTRLLTSGRIKTAAVLDFDLHFGDGNVNILSNSGVVEIYNPEDNDRQSYLSGVESFLNGLQVDMIGVSTGFDNHIKDWGGLLTTEDYFVMARMVKERAEKTGTGYFGILEGGYNHSVLGQNVLAFLEGMEKESP